MASELSEPSETNATSKDNVSACSETTSLFDGSVVSNVPDRHGFLGGSQYNRDPRPGPSADTVLQREKKWLKMLSRWETYMDKNYRKVKERCRKGIPMSVRPKAWFYLCGATLLLEKNMGLYEQYGLEEGDEKCIADIRKDLHRQFPFHEMFVSEDRPGQRELFQVLKAYTMWNSVDGYCQAQAPVAAFLLMQMPAVQAFWCLVSIYDRYVPGYYSPGLEVLQRDGDMLEALLKRTCPAAHRHLQKVRAEPVFYMTEWFLCCFTRTLPWDSLLRVWDIFLCEGVKVLFKTALVILAGCLGSSRLRSKCPGLCETLQVLRNPPEHVLSEEYLVHRIARLTLTEHDFALEHQRQTAKRRQAKQEQQQQQQEQQQSHR